MKNKKYNTDGTIPKLNIKIGERAKTTIRLFRIMSIPITFRLFRVVTSEMLGGRLPVYTLFL
jgi:hypothetical protein